MGRKYREERGGTCLWNQIFSSSGKSVNFGYIVVIIVLSIGRRIKAVSKTIQRPAPRERDTE